MSDPFIMWIPGLHLLATDNVTLVTTRNGENNDFNNHISILALNPVVNGSETLAIGDAGLSGSAWISVEPWSQYKYKAKDVIEGSYSIEAMADCQGYLTWMYGHKSYRSYGYLGVVGDLPQVDATGKLMTQIPSKSVEEFLQRHPECMTNSWQCFTYLDWHPYNNVNLGEIDNFRVEVLKFD